ncbi:hypothetical protein [Streptomyces sp. MI02-7b]|uniref:hypothetical protein n=1 Tax=Streptomyces sp. MI02-7b TaxID=462941 RepID=UPI0029A5CAE1|nr:hypothetical protein [Streptomyces sp. MI02-7b]MDX3077327.1 hypothetical protein [Streptomyces sp. MI02-7b]
MPESVYDELRTPERCSDGLNAIPQEESLPPNWMVLRGLAHACLAIQGFGGWHLAAEDYAALTGRLNGCKFLAAYDALGRLLAFHRAHPGVTVRPRTSDGGAAACDFAIESVDAGGSSQAYPGATVRLELHGAFFYPTSLRTNGEILLDHDLSPAIQTLEWSGDRITVTFLAPEGLDSYPQTFDVTVRYMKTEITAPDALTILDPASVPQTLAPSGLAGTLKAPAFAVAR